MTSTFETSPLDFDFSAKGDRPTSSDLITQLLALEKTAKKEKRLYPFEQLLGTWQLTFITGTKKAKKNASKVLGKGRYLPSWLKVAIAYRSNADHTQTTEWQTGTTINSVQFGLLNLTVSGPIKFHAQKRLLAFDFLQMTIKLGGLQLYSGNLRGGADAAEKFKQTPIAKQPFFSYFYVSEQAIAARGRGGGIALWTKTK